ncbi:hypothetical protein EXU57_23060 [Segetibacter sp. 3557_3]|nr:hypothetical protein EXU57_23060 [Segetibacter sp. 3557_3]
MIVGGYALAFHGKPRHTGDLDIWINISELNATRMLQVLSDFGLSSMRFKKQDFLKAGYMSQIGYPPLRIDILNSIDGVDFGEAKGNMQTVRLDDDLVVNYIGLNEFVRNKKASGRSQDIADIKEIQMKQLARKVPGKGKKL